jgi:hypothetical protein
MENLQEQDGRIDHVPSGPSDEVMARAHEMQEATLADLKDGHWGVSKVFETESGEEIHGGYAFVLPGEFPTMVGDKAVAEHKFLMETLKATEDQEDRRSILREAFVGKLTSTIDGHALTAEEFDAAWDAAERLAEEEFGDDLGTKNLPPHVRAEIAASLRKGRAGFAPVTYVSPAESVGVAEIVDGVINVGGVEIELMPGQRIGGGQLPVFVRRRQDQSVIDIAMSFADGLEMEELAEMDRQAELHPGGPKAYWRDKISKADGTPLSDKEFEDYWSEGHEDEDDEDEEILTLKPTPVSTEAV